MAHNESFESTTLRETAPAYDDSLVLSQAAASAAAQTATPRTIAPSVSTPLRSIIDSDVYESPYRDPDLRHRRTQESKDAWAKKLASAPPRAPPLSKREESKLLWGKKVSGLKERNAAAAPHYIPAPSANAPSTSRAPTFPSSPTRSDASRSLLATHVPARDVYADTSRSLLKIPHTAPTDFLDSPIHLTPSISQNDDTYSTSRDPPIPESDLEALHQPVAEGIEDSAYAARDVFAADNAMARPRNQHLEEGTASDREAERGFARGRGGGRGRPRRGHGRGGAPPPAAARHVLGASHTAGGTTQPGKSIWPKDLAARLEKMKEPLSEAFLGRTNKRPRSESTNEAAEADRVAETGRGASRGYRTIQQKLDLFFWFLRVELQWSYGQLLYLSAARPENPMSASQTQNHCLTNFLQGQDHHYFPSRIIDLWFRHSYGSINYEPDKLYATDVSFAGLRHVRLGLSAWAAQLIEQKLVREAEAAIAVDSGLHISLGKKSDAKPLEWSDLGAATVSNVRGVLLKHQPLLYYLVSAVASRKPRQVDGEDVVRQHRTVDNVATNAISILDFSRSNRANLLPLASGVLHFGSLASWDLFRYHSRVGNMPSYSTILRAMQRLSEDAALRTRLFGEDPQTLYVLRFDNVHNYLLQRDMALGRESKLITGSSGALYEAPKSANIDVFALDAYRRSLAENRRQSMTVRKLYELIDQKHVMTILSLQWLRVLADFVPQLRSISPYVSNLYRSLASKLPLPATKTQVHPLASSSKNEVYLTELKEYIIDMLEQGGQTQANFKQRLQPIGGDGLTFEKLLELHEFLQFEGNAFDSFEILFPLLEGWHKDWTEVCDIFETHYGQPQTRDYSALGHSAAKLGRRRPADLKKVDYSQGTQLMFLTLDARMLDCWRLYYKTDDLFEYFEAMEHADGGLPTCDELLSIARKLARAYMSMNLHDVVMSGVGIEQTILPIGESWDTVIQDDSSKDFGEITHGKAAQHAGAKRTKSRSRKAQSQQETGDHVLANSRLFMRRAALLRESMLAAAEGDPGRVYEMTKCQLFHFAGGSHSKYTDYVLEMIVRLEEASPELKEEILRLSLVNLTGKPGAFSYGDLVQEYFNRLLDAVVRHKGVEYGDSFIRNVWSRNLHHVAQLKGEWLEGLGLKQRSAAHSDPSRQADMRTLLNVYRTHQLHTYRPHRIIVDDNLDRFSAGYQSLEKKKLASFLRRSLLRRGVAQKLPSTAPTDVSPVPSNSQDGVTIPGGEGDTDADGDDADVDGEEHVGGPDEDMVFAQVIDGHLFVLSTDLEEEMLEVLDHLHLQAHGDGEELEDEIIPSSDPLPEIEDAEMDRTSDIEYDDC
ncbi:hypothetical protein BD626DRAFT_474783 [Schizophyllum amplum]|uniref:DUF6589 domain-containing protein n=1 Tax=Schizophyllum amplum TaxID=97359 RepID=A0A550CXW1_9AGAR|nr:hypothetical protein BD626DRAFT_474783 [Auriculariopsis ampla]